MGNARELFITGLQNAHAMESQAQEILERQIERMDKYPDMRARLQEHLSETKAQMQRLESCLSDLDSSPSTMKDTALAFGANMAAMGHAMAKDEVLKNAFANNALENYEIAAYKSLLTLCDRAGMTGAAPALQASLHEEERMAAWIDEHVADVTLQYLSKEEREANAA